MLVSELPRAIADEEPDRESSPRSMTRLRVCCVADSRRSPRGGLSRGSQLGPHVQSVGFGPGVGHPHGCDQVARGGFWRSRPRSPSTDRHRRHRCRAVRTRGPARRGPRSSHLGPRGGRRPAGSGSATGSTRGWAARRGTTSTPWPATAANDQVSASARRFGHQRVACEGQAPRHGYRAEVGARGPAESSLAARRSSPIPGCRGLRRDVDADQCLWLGYSPQVA